MDTNTVITETSFPEDTLLKKEEGQTAGVRGWRLGTEAFNCTVPSCDFWEGVVQKHCRFVYFFIY